MFQPESLTVTDQLSHHLKLDLCTVPPQDTDPLNLVTTFASADLRSVQACLASAVCGLPTVSVVYSKSPIEAEAFILGFQHCPVMLGTTVIIATIIVPYMGGSNEKFTSKPKKMGSEIDDIFAGKKRKKPDDLFSVNISRWVVLFHLICLMGFRISAAEHKCLKRKVKEVVKSIYVFVVNVLPASIVDRSSSSNTSRFNAQQLLNARRFLTVLLLSMIIICS